MTAAIPSALPVLILHTGDPDDTLKSQFGGYAEQLAQAAGLSAVRLSPEELASEEVSSKEFPSAKPVSAEQTAVG